MNASGAFAVALGVDTAEVCFQIEEFTGDICVVNLAFEVYFFVAAASTSATDDVPIFFVFFGVLVIHFVLIACWIIKNGENRAKQDLNHLDADLHDER
jgi:hypothetical protein